MTRAHTIVVGGTKGIGRTVVGRLASEAHLVSAIGRRATAGRDNVPHARAWAADVADHAALDRALDQAVRAHGPASGMVLLQRFRGEGDDWAGELATTLTATRHALEWAAEHLEDRGTGKAIVVIGSAAGRFVASEQPVSYHVAKAGLEQMVRYFAVSLGPKGIRVNTIAPGTIVKEESMSFYRDHPELEQLYRDIVPIGRMGTAADVAELVAFLLSERASFLTGQTIVLDGGVSLHWHESLARRVSPMRELPVARPPQKKS